MADNRMRQEVREAIEAGEQALASLQAASRQLNGARNWGIADLLGGGFFTGLFKHQRIKDASEYIEEAKQDLQVFERELRDVTVLPSDMKIQVGNFLVFADFFFDGLVADYLVQSSINEARSQVAETIYRMETLLGNLRQYA